MSHWGYRDLFFRKKKDLAYALNNQPLHGMTEVFQFMISKSPSTMTEIT